MTTTMWRYAGADWAVFAPQRSALAASAAPEPAAAPHSTARASAIAARRQPWRSRPRAHPWSLPPVTGRILSSRRRAGQGWTAARRGRGDRMLEIAPDHYLPLPYEGERLSEEESLARSR